MKILDDELEREILNTIGVDRMGIFKMYQDLNVSRQHFERNFVMEEPFEELLSEKVWAAFLYFDMSRAIDRSINK